MIKCASSKKMPLNTCKPALGYIAHVVNSAGTTDFDINKMLLSDPALPRRGRVTDHHTRRTSRHIIS